MRHPRWLSLASVLLVGWSATTAEPPPGYVSETLPNGMAVSILPDARMPLVATELWYHVGSANEEPRTRGFAHLFEHLMFGGTSSTSKGEVWELHERHGGSCNAYTSFDDTVFVSEIPPAGHPRLLALEADRMANLSLTAENLENEKRIVTEELRLRTENSPMSRLYVQALSELLGGHPYALEPTGTKEDIAAATLEHAAQFYERYYKPRNAHLVVVGPVDGRATLATIRETFGTMPAEGETPPDVPSLATWTLPPELELSEDLPPVEIALLGFTLPPADDPDAEALELMVALLTGTRVDPVEEELVRRRGKALYAGVETMRARRGGGLALYAVQLPYRRKATAYRILEETRQKLAAFEWLDEEKLAAARRRMAIAEMQGAYHASWLASRIGRAAWYEGDERRAFDRLERIEAVRVEDVEAVFRRTVLEPQPVRMYVSPRHVPVLVRLFGWLAPVMK